MGASLCRESKKKSKARPALEYSRQNGLTTANQTDRRRHRAAAASGQIRRPVANDSKAGQGQKLPARQASSGGQRSAKRGSGTQVATGRQGRPSGADKKQCRSYSIEQLKHLRPSQSSGKSQTRKDEWRQLCQRQEQLRSLALGNGVGIWRFAQLDESYYSKVASNNLKLPVDLTNLANFSPSKYFDALLDLLQFEEAYRAVELRKYDQVSHNLDVSHQVGQPSQIDVVGFFLNGLSDSQTSIISPGDEVLLFKRELAELHVCVIDSIEDNFVSLNLNKWRMLIAGTLVNVLGSMQNRSISDWNHDLSKKFDLYLVGSDDNLVLCRNAINLCKSNKSHVIFSRQPDAPLVDYTLVSSLDVDTNPSLDERQVAAIKAILSGSHLPIPYVLTGAPGSGKTQTLVEAAFAVCQFVPNSKILVCAKSPTCVAQLYARLLSKIAGRTKVLKLCKNSKQKFDKKKVDSTRLIVGEIFKLGCLVSENIKFDYVFVDEANHTNIAETFVPISLLRNSTSLILVGDSNQLGPNDVRSKLASELGLGKSLFECLLNTQAYKPDPAGLYSTNCITKLNTSYRCEKEILASSCALFYANEVECKPTGANLLDKLKSPNSRSLQFVCGNVAATRWTNPAEAVACSELLMKLNSLGVKPEQVGIVSPFRQQAKLISETVRNKLDIKSASQACLINTVEGFQGLERDVIIISTVRTSKVYFEDSTEDEASFLNNERHFNVAVSRAKWLVVVVGDRYYLDKIDFWKVFMKDLRALRLPNSQSREQANKPANSKSNQSKNMLATDSNGSKIRSKVQPEK